MLISCVYSSSTPSFILQVSLCRWNTPWISFRLELEVVLRLCTKIQTQRVVQSCVRGCSINYLNPPSKVVIWNELLHFLYYTTVFFLDFFWGVDSISVGDTLIIDKVNLTYFLSITWVCLLQRPYRRKGVGRAQRSNRSRISTQQ